MRVLGLSPLDKDSTVAVVENGEITYAAAEERFTRVKLQDGFPWRALADALQATGTRVEEVGAVVYPFLNWQEETRLFERNLATEREFLDEAESFETNAQLRAARGRIPERHVPESADHISDWVMRDVTPVDERPLRRPSRN